jgi:hypothetical protein
MTNLEQVASLTHGAFQVGAKGPRELALSGELAMRDPVAEVGPHFKKIHDAAVADGLGGAELVVDLTNLKYANSSGLRIFLDWVVWVSTAAAEQRYSLRFRLAKSATWQAAAFPAIAAIGGPVVKTESV